MSVHGNTFFKETVETVLLIYFDLLHYTVGLILFSLMTCLHAFYNYFSVADDKSRELGLNLIVSFCT